jgi:hypothetical protein
MGDNIKLDIQEEGWGNMDCINRAQNRAVVKAAMNLRV